MSDVLERKGRFLERLGEVQADAGLTDADLARELGVNHSTVWRAKRAPDRTFGLDFALKACDRFPELRSLLFCDSPIGIMDAPIGKDEGGA